MLKCSLYDKSSNNVDFLNENEKPKPFMISILTTLVNHVLTSFMSSVVKSLLKVPFICFERFALMADSNVVTRAKRIKVVWK